MLDLVFDSAPAQANPNLPRADYLPALEKQRELERQLAEQQELLRKLQQQQQMQMQPQAQQPLPGGMGYPAPYGQPQQQQPPAQKPSYSNDLLDLQMPAPSYPAPMSSNSAASTFAGLNFQPGAGGAFQQPNLLTPQPFPVAQPTMGMPMGMQQQQQQQPPAQYQPQGFPAQPQQMQQQQVPLQSFPAMGGNYYGQQPQQPPQQPPLLQPMGGGPSQQSFQSIGGNFSQQPQPTAMGGYPMSNPPAPPVPAAPPVPETHHRPHDAQGFLDAFHRQYQSHSIRFTESPVMDKRNLAETSQAPDTSSKPYDPTAQLWSYDHGNPAGPPPAAPPAIPSQPPLAGYPGQYGGQQGVFPGQQQQMPMGMGMGMGSAFPPQQPPGVPLGPLPPVPPPPVPNFHP